MIGNAKWHFQQFPVGCPGLESQLRRITVVLLIENFHLDQLIAQPDGGIITLAHDA